MDEGKLIFVDLFFMTLGRCSSSIMWLADAKVREILMDIIDDRFKETSTNVSSQIPVSNGKISPVREP